MILMSQLNIGRTIFVVTGVSLRAEQMDRPLAYGLADVIRQRIAPDSPWKPLVVSDVIYLNDDRVARCPTISLGGPGVNQLSQMLFGELPSVLAIDNSLIIQMDIELKDARCCLWGMDHEQTVQAIDLFRERGYLDTFLKGVTGGQATATDA